MNWISTCEFPRKCIWISLIHRHQRTTKRVYLQVPHAAVPDPCSSLYILYIGWSPSRASCRAAHCIQCPRNESSNILILAIIESSMALVGSVTCPTNSKVMRAINPIPTTNNVWNWGLWRCDPRSPTTPSSREAPPIICNRNQKTVGFWCSIQYLALARIHREYCRCSWLKVCIKQHIWLHMNVQLAVQHYLMQ